MQTLLRTFDGLILVYWSSLFTIAFEPCDSLVQKLFPVLKRCFNVTLFIAAVLQHVSELAMVIDPEGMDFQVQKVHINTVKVRLPFVLFKVNWPISGLFI